MYHVTRSARKCRQHRFVLESKDYLDRICGTNMVPVVYSMYISYKDNPLPFCPDLPVNILI